MDEFLQWYDVLHAVITSQWFQNISEGFVFFIIAFWIALVIWIARDIVQRSDSLVYQIISILLGMFFIPGWLLYLMVRPSKTLTERYNEELERRAFLESLEKEHRHCHKCDGPIEESFIFCPHCKAKLKNICGHCKRLLDLDWVYCPHCSTKSPDEDQSNEDETQKKEEGKKKSKTLKKRT